MKLFEDQTSDDRLMWFLFVFQVVEYILDRNACLLPAYFAVTEIRKLYPEGQLSHWVNL